MGWETEYVCENGESLEIKKGYSKDDLIKLNVNELEEYEKIEYLQLLQFILKNSETIKTFDAIEEMEEIEMHRKFKLKRSTNKFFIILIFVKYKILFC